MNYHVCLDKGNVGTSTVGSMSSGVLGYHWRVPGWKKPVNNKGVNFVSQELAVSRFPLRKEEMALMALWSSCWHCSVLWPAAHLFRLRNGLKRIISDSLTGFLVYTYKMSSILYTYILYASYILYINFRACIKPLVITSVRDQKLTWSP